MAAFHEDTLYPLLATYVRENRHGFDGIAAERRTRLEEIALYVGKRIEANELSRLTFICTHNSRRSHMSQIWAQTAAAYYGVPDVLTFSGGTEATAFNPRAVAVMQRAGFVIEKTTGGDNPVYTVRYGDVAPAMEAFSKVYNDPPNPSEDYCAVMTCSQADANCPIVHGAAERVSIPFGDPKDFDGTDRETAKYDERCRQISVEMLYVFSRVTL